MARVNLCRSRILQGRQCVRSRLLPRDIPLNLLVDLLFEVVIGVKRRFFNKFDLHCFKGDLGLNLRDEVASNRLSRFLVQ